MGAWLNKHFLTAFGYGPVSLVEAFNVQHHIIIRHISWTFQQMLQEFQIVTDRFGTLSINELNGWDTLTKAVLVNYAFIHWILTFCTLGIYFWGLYNILILTFYFAMSWNGPTHFKNLAANVARFFRCVWPFNNIAKERVKIVLRNCVYCLN